MALKRVPVLLVVAVGVAHGMGVLALDQGPGLCLIIGPGLNLHGIEMCWRSVPWAACTKICTKLDVSMG